MLKDHIFRISLQKGPATIFVFGDLQFGSSSFVEEAWDQFVDDFKSTPNAWALGLGDYEDWLRPSMRAPLYASLTKDSSARFQLDDKTKRDQDRGIFKMMSFLEGRLIGLHSGHHEWDFSDGTNSTQRLCSLLRAPYLGWMASTRLVFHGVGLSSRGTVNPFTVLSMHGSGNSRTTSSDVRWFESNIVPAWDADFFVKGHSAKAVEWVAFTKNKVRRVGPPGIETVAPRCMAVGGFCEGYTNGTDFSYVERSGFLPQPTSWGKIKVSLSCKASLRQQKGLLGKKTKSLFIEPSICGPQLNRV